MKSEQQQNLLNIDNNTSGNPDSILPEELKGLNWGGFFLNWIWSVAHQAWLGLILSLLCGIVGSIFLLFKGNEIAWKNKYFESIEDFKKKQKTWAVAGLIVFIALLLFFTIIFLSILIPSVYQAKEKGQFTVCKNEIKKIYIAYDMYSADNNGVYPENLGKLIGPYLPKEPKCPVSSTNTYICEFNENKTSFKIYCKGKNHFSVIHEENGPAYGVSSGLVNTLKEAKF